MKKYLFLILFANFFANSEAQTSVYHPFPDSNATWGMHTQGCCWAMCSTPIMNPALSDSYFSYFINGDTIINSITYHKLYKSGITHEHCEFGNEIDNWYSFNNELDMLYRQDTVARQVVAYNTYLQQEILFYDFNLKVGDSLECLAISSIDSVLVGNNYRKKFVLKNSNDFFIEGIGKTTGLHEPLCPFEFFGQLICFSQNGKTLFPDTNSACANVTHVDVIGKPRVVCFPNPFNNRLNLSTNTNTNEPAEIILFDLTSRKCLEQKFTNSISLNTSQLASGLYFYEVRNENGTIAKGKVVKE